MGFARRTSSRPVAGAQSVDRAVALLGRIAASHASGASLRELQEATGLDRTTAWRIVSALAHHGLAGRDEDSGRYHLGLEAMAWGMACMDRAPLVEACRPTMMALARMSGDNVFLVVRSGDFSHCLHLEEGRNVVRTFALNVGSTRLLGLGVASIALLARLDDEDLAVHFERHEAEYRSHEVGLAKLQRWVAGTRESGYSHVSAAGVAGVGVWFALGSCGDAAMSIIAPRSRLPRARGSELAAMISSEIARGAGG